MDRLKMSGFCRMITRVSVFGVIMVNSCMPDQDFNVGVPECMTAEGKMKEVSEVMELYTDKPVLITDDWIIEGVVISDDASGDFYGEVYFQDRVENPRYGFLVKSEALQTNLAYPKGQRVLVKLKGIFAEVKNGILVLGGLSRSFGEYVVGRLPARAVHEHVQAICESPLDLVPLRTDPEGLKRVPYGLLVEVQEVQFKGNALCRVLLQEQTTTQFELENCKGASVFTAIGGYVDFGDEEVPASKGSLQGIWVRQGQRSLIRPTGWSDFRFDSDRCESLVFQCELPEPDTSIQELRQSASDSVVKFTGTRVVEGVVTASDSGGNLSELIYLQDASGGIRIRLKGRSLYQKGFEEGSRIRISLAGLAIQKDPQGVVMIGEAGATSVTPVPEQHWYRYFRFMGQAELPEIIELPLNAIDATYAGRLVRIDQLQFEPEISVMEDIQRLNMPALADCEGRRLNLGLSASSVFYDIPVPEGHGGVTGVLEPGPVPVILPRSENDLSLEDPRCDLSLNARAVSVSWLKQAYASQSYIQENLKISAWITGTFADEGGKGFGVTLEDETGGILLVLDQWPSLPRGSLVDLWLRGLHVKENGPGFALKGTLDSKILNTAAGRLPEPVEFNLNSINEAQNWYRWGVLFSVMIESSDTDGKLSLTDCFQQMPLFWQGMSDPRENGLEGKMVTAFGVNLPEGFLVRDQQDIEPSAGITGCRELRSQEGILISELADPENTTSDNNLRFVELFNAGTTAANLNGWSLRRYTNANTFYTEGSIIYLDGHILNPGETLVIAAVKEDFDKVYPTAADLQGGVGSAADSNGDDTIALYDGNNELSDIYGRPGEDGTGTGRDFENGRAVRKLEVKRGNSEFLLDEWLVFNEIQDQGAFTGAQTAPGDFSPGTHP